MADYSSLKVPELKKLLAEKKLPQTGNKADLIARLHEDDKKKALSESEKADNQPTETKEDEITYSDDEPAVVAPTSKSLDDKPAEEPAAFEPASTTVEASEKKSVDEPSKEPAGDKPKKAEEPAQSFAIGLSSSTADEELKRRADRAKRFGIDIDEEAKRLAERAKRFGLEDKDLAAGLDSALPERQLKRGRGRNDGEGTGPDKRRSQDRRSVGGSGVGGERRSARNEATASKFKLSGVLNDPFEKAKAEKRAARFAAA